MVNKKIRSVPDHQQLRKKIEMRYASPEKEKTNVPVKSINRGVEIKKALIRYYMKTMNVRRLQIDDS